jgi:hypothetical protein
VLRSSGWQHVVPAADSHVADWWLDTRKGIAKPRRRAFHSVVLVVARSILVRV